MNLTELLKIYKNAEKSQGKRKHDKKYTGKNLSCGDEVTIYVKLENNRISYISFEAAGCAISTSFTYLLSEKMKAVNSLDTALPQTEVAQAILRFLNLSDSGKTRKVLIIGYDGVRLDAVVQAETPAVDSNAEDTGFYVLFTGGNRGENSEQFTLSGPGWATILTGVWADTHKFTSTNCIEIS